MRRLFFVLALLLIYAIIGLRGGFSEPSPKELQVHMIELPTRGDAILIRTPGDENILIDCGEKKAGPKVVAYLKKQGVQAIDLLVITHDHKDHLGGADSVVNAFKVKDVWLSAHPDSKRRRRQRQKELAGERDIMTFVVKGQKLAFGEVELEVLAPSKPLISDDNRIHEKNENSVVIALRFKKRRFLFTGDIQGAAEKRLEENDAASIRCDVLKIAHHGSPSSTRKEFLEKARPKYALISARRRFFSRDADKVTLDKIAAFAARERSKAKKVEWYRTDLNGSIVVSTDGQSLELAVKRGEKNMRSDKD